MAYGKIKADAIIRYNTSTSQDEEVTVDTLIATGNGLTAKADTTTVNSALALKADLASPTLTSPTLNSPSITSPTFNGSATIPQMVGGVTAVAALDLDCSTSNYFTKTINGNSTFTFSSIPSTGSFSFTLELTHTSGTITWPTSVKWNKDTAPTLTTGKTHLFMFVTDDGGTRFRGSALVDYVN